jgi:hypothetical protein
MSVAIIAGRKSSTLGPPSNPHQSSGFDAYETPSSDIMTSMMPPPSSTVHNSYYDSNITQQLTSLTQLTASHAPLIAPFPVSTADPNVNERPPSASGQSTFSHPSSIASSAGAHQEKTNALKRTRYLSRAPTYTDLTHSQPSGHTQRTISPLPPMGWDEGRQLKLERSLIRMTASNNWAFNWIENPETVDFFSKFLPLAKVPRQKALSNRILDNSLADIRSESMQRAKGLMVTLQSDGWTGGNHNHFQAFMMTGGRQVSH